MPKSRYPKYPASVQVIGKDHNGDPEFGPPLKNVVCGYCGERIEKGDHEAFYKPDAGWFCNIDHWDYSTEK